MPETALEAYEAALSSVCSGVSFFHNTTMDRWRVEGLKPVGRDEPALAAALALAASVSGCDLFWNARRRFPTAGWHDPMPRSRNS